MGSIVKKVEILEVEQKTSKSGKAYRVCQCVVHGEKKRVGELMVFRPEIDLAEGTFIAEFDVGVNYERMVVAELVRLVPFKEPAPAAVARPSAS